MISVIVPTYNSACTVKQCLASIRASEGAHYELIVADDGSADKTVSIAEQYADKILLHPRNLGRSRARNTGARAAKGDILVFIDSDIIIRRNTLAKISDFFQREPSADAVTGLLSKEHPNQDFFSQYKNYYMNYIFSKLPEKINFLFGSIYAVRKKALIVHDSDYELAEDSAHGQKLAKRGKELRFMKDLDVIHLKKYNFISIIKNDFRIPFNWADIFIKYRGWRHLFRNRTGYLHSPKEQLVSIFLVFFIMALWLILPAKASLVYAVVFLMIAWAGMNCSFWFFLFRTKGLPFVLLAIIWTFADQIIMSAGILAGFVYGIGKELRVKKRLGKKPVIRAMR